MDKTYAFLDECGNHDLDVSKRGVSDYFVIISVLIGEGELESLKLSVEGVRKKYFQTGEMKSSGIGNNHKRRASVLTAIDVLDFKFYVLVVNKNDISKDSGYKFKKSFLKNINGKIYNKLFSRFRDVHIVADEHGGEEFKDSFRRYIEANHKPDLFFESKFDLVKSEDNILVQLADILVGSISKVYEKKVPQEVIEIYLSLLKNKCLGIDEWPTRFQAISLSDSTTDEYSQLILTHSLSSAEIFVENNESSKDENVKLQVAVAKFLVFHSRWVSKSSYVGTRAILNHLLDSGYGKISEPRLRSKVIAKLRDGNVIISSSNKGYKTPCSFEDMETFVETVNGRITPLLERLSRARSNLRLASRGEVDILKGPKYPHLVSFIDALEKR